MIRNNGYTSSICTVTVHSSIHPFFFSIVLFHQSHKLFENVPRNFRTLFVLFHFTPTHISVPTLKVISIIMMSIMHDIHFEIVQSSYSSGRRRGLLPCSELQKTLTAHVSSQFEQKILYIKAHDYR